MSAKTTTAPLTSRERLARGLTYSAVGPVDVTRGVVGVGVHSIGSSAGWLRDRYRSARVRAELAAISRELSAVGDVVGNLPQALQEARSPKRRPRPLMLAGAAVVVLAVGAASFSIIRRSTRPDPSPLPPSVDVTPKP